jgi:CheY-like chemotaxis protein
LASISHEMRTPLNGIIGVIDLMSHIGNDHPSQLYIKTLEQSCRVLLSVVNRLQDISYLHNPLPYNDGIVFDIRAVLSGIAENMQYFNAESSESTQLNINIDSRIPSIVRGDLTKIQQTFTNLVTVAALISEKHYSSIQLRLKYLYGNEATFGVLVRTNTIINKEFFRLTENMSIKFNNADLFNTGTLNNMFIGLNICRRFISVLGSQLTISKVKDTLHFEFDLALHSEEKLPRVIHDDNIKLSDFTVLVADDNVINLLIIVKMLNHLGVKSTTVADGQQVINKLENETFDMIFMDLEMPVMDGFDATKYIRNKMKNYLIIVALTANSTNEAKQKCKNVGMNDYFTKPITIQTIKEMIYKWGKTS